MVDKIREVYNVYQEQDLLPWLKSNHLTQLQDYETYKNDVKWGQAYRLDQIYFEKISEAKNIVFGVITKLESIKATHSDRILKMKVDNFLDELNVELKKLDNLLFTARERLKFYENIMRVIGNVTWGSY